MSKALGLKDCSSRAFSGLSTPGYLDNHIENLNSFIEA